MIRSLKAKLLSAIVAVVAIVVALLLAEGASRFLVDPADFLTVLPVQDPVLGHRIEPGAGGHDANGFRNREVPKQANIVVIGDSMTYGSGAARDAAWPQQLESLSGESVYNMGMGGYGPMQYLHLSRTLAKEFKPRQLIVGFYFGNDFADANAAVQNLAQWRNWSDSPPAASAPAATLPPRSVDTERRGAALRDWLSRHSVVYGLLRTSLLQPFAAMEQKKVADRVSDDERMSWADPAAPGVKTVFTPLQRLLPQDQTKPDVKAGMRISKRAFVALKDEADKQGIPLLIVLIPTRERAYCPYLVATGITLPPAYEKLCRTEDANKAEIVKLLSDKAIQYVDASPALEAQVALHLQIYPPTSDGHPTALGHQAIAQAVQAALKRR